MKTIRVFKGLIALSAVFAVPALCAPNIQAEAILDDFSTPSTASNITFNSTGTTTFDTSSVLGGTRTAITDVTTVATIKGGASIGAGSLALSTGTNGNASLTVVYTGISQNLSSFMDLNFLFSAVGSSSPTMPFSVALNGMSNQNAISVPIINGSENVFVPLTAANFPGVNFSSIRSITLTFNGPSNTTTGFVLSNFGADPPPSAVPEPASLALWGVLGMAGMWYGRRKMQRKLAV